MIPLAVLPLQNVTVLVTRPAGQNENLCASINDLGGNAIALPTIVIEPVIPANESALADVYDWIIFTSANAVKYGLPRISRNERTRIAAIGRATATALDAHDLTPDALPETGASSETLLKHPAFDHVSDQSVLLVKGVGGREVLANALRTRGAQVTELEVYRRSVPAINARVIDEIEGRWATDGIDVVTLTSVETLQNLFAMLTEGGRRHLRSTVFATVSERIVARARELGLTGLGLVSRNADDESLIGAIAAWHARAR